MYIPDKWVILKIESSDNPVFKLLSSKYGGYLEGDSWRLNSGITSIVELNSHYIIRGHSGSEYKCFKNSEGLSTISASILSDLKEQLKEKIETLKTTVEIVSVKECKETF